MIELVVEKYCVVAVIVGFSLLIASSLIGAGLAIMFGAHIAMLINKNQIDQIDYAKILPSYDPQVSFSHKNPPPKSVPPKNRILPR